MLSRTADHLFWMSRQIERAEGLARILDAHYRHALLPHTADVVARDWRATLSSLGVLDAYRARHASFSPSTAFRFLAFDRDHGGSIVSCLWAARENARAVRGTITSEMWETLNATWLEIRGYEPDTSDGAIGDFLEWVRYRAHLSRGVTLGTMLRDEAFRFTRIGTFLEGADATARMLLARARPGHAPADEPAGPDAYVWTLLLRSLSAFEVYRKVYRDAVTPWRVTELLVLRDDLPRSLHRCTTEIYANLCAVANDQSAETERRAGELQSTFRFGRLEQLLAPGLADFLGGFLGQVGDLGRRIAQDFLVPVTPY
jgi:uncharacterized alpha-E superfamily protein